MSRVKPMKKVNVSLSLLDGSLEAVAANKVVSFTFIYGIGHDGLSLFECCLEDSGVGDTVTFEVTSSSGQEFFSGLFPTIYPLLEGRIMPERLTFKAEIKGLEDVENREVVAALASSASGCGSGGSCGCGCS